MKKNIFFTVFIMLSSTIFGQDIIINFAGEGASSNVETVEVVNLTNCTSIEVQGNSSLNLSDYPVGAEELGSFESNLIQSCPNPFDNYTNIEFYISENDKVKILISDIAGKIVAEYSREMIPGVHSFEFTANSLGMYFISVSGTNFVHTSKVMCISNSSQKAQLIYKEQVTTQFVKKSHKSGSSKDFSFTEGDMLKLIGISGDYASVMIVEPTVSETYTFNFAVCTDYDENNYAVVQIGGQIWMAENLKTTHYSDGSEILLVEDDTDWGELEDNNDDKAYCYYDIEGNETGEIYGALYTWAAASNGETSETNPSGIQGACPSGWHLPSDAEWTELTEYLIGNAGGKLKSACTSLWNAPNTGATNETGFSALPAGGRYYNTGSFSGEGSYCDFWSATQSSETYVWWRVFYFADAGFYRGTNYKSSGFPVRCVLD